MIKISFFSENKLSSKTEKRPLPPAHLYNFDLCSFFMCLISEALCLKTFLQLLHLKLMDSCILS